jgi:hypothetical protein
MCFLQFKESQKIRKNKDENNFNGELKSKYVWFDIVTKQKIAEKVLQTKVDYAGVVRVVKNTNDRINVATFTYEISLTTKQVTLCGTKAFDQSDDLSQASMFQLCKTVSSKVL